MAQENGYNLILCNTDEDAAKEAQYLQVLMEKRVDGIILATTGQSLRAVREIRTLWLDIEEFYRKTRLSDSLVGLRNSVQCALIIARAAQRNRISRGCHYREDSRVLETASPR